MEKNATALQCSPVPQPGPRRQCSGAMAGGGCAGPLLLLTLLLLGPRLRSGHRGHYRSVYTQVPVQLESTIITERAPTKMAFNKQKTLVVGAFSLI